ncbi:hypothetical protein FACS1894216_17000 [Synergistales bacterium]|nr:hypothetical protein FACS1894216_17000 [Synergistales bacterium]
MKTLEDKRTLSKWFAHTANWFVLFVRTGGEDSVVARVQRKLDPEKYVVFVPTKDRAFRKKSKVETIKAQWMSGYVFIAATVDETELLEAVAPLIMNDPNIYRLLANGSPSDGVKLTERDKSIMTALLDETFNIPAVEAVFVGDEVKIVESSLEGFGGRVKRVNKHKYSATIEMDMFGKTIDCEIMLEYLTKPEKVIKANGYDGSGSEVSL